MVIVVCPTQSLDIGGVEQLSEPNAATLRFGLPEPYMCIHSWFSNYSLLSIFFSVPNASTTPSSSLEHNTSLFPGMFVILD